MDPKKRPYQFFLEYLDLMTFRARETLANALPEQDRDAFHALADAGDDSGALAFARQAFGITPTEADEADLAVLALLSPSAEGGRFLMPDWKQSEEPCEGVRMHQRGRKKPIADKLMERLPILQSVALLHNVAWLRTNYLPDPNDPERINDETADFMAGSMMTAQRAHLLFAAFEAHLIPAVARSAAGQAARASRRAKHQKTEDDFKRGYEKVLQVLMSDGKPLPKRDDIIAMVCDDDTIPPAATAWARAVEQGVGVVRQGGRPKGAP